MTFLKFINTNKFWAGLCVFALPVGAFALNCAGASASTPLASRDFTWLVCLFISWLVPLINLVFALVVLIFMWGIVKYLSSADDKEKMEEGRKLLVYGVIAIFVAVSVWGIVKFIQTSLGILPT